MLTEGALYALGFHKHNRGEWRMKRELGLLKNAITALEKRKSERAPLITYTASASDAEAVDLFARARSGEADAQARVHALIRDRKWQDWIGNIALQATCQLISKAAGGDPVWEAGITQKANALRQELLGETPTVLDELLVRRVVNGWIATHALELEQTVRPPADARDRAHLDRALSRAEADDRRGARTGARSQVGVTRDPGTHRGQAGEFGPDNRVNEHSLRTIARGRENASSHAS